VPVAVQVLAVADGRAALAVRPDPGDGSAADATVVVLLDLDDGTLTPLGGAQGRAAAGAIDDDGSVTVALAAPGDADQVDVLVLAQGETTQIGSLPGAVTSLRVDGDTATVVTTDGYAVQRPDGATLVDDPTVDVRDVLHLDGTTTVLVRVDGRSVLLVGVPD
jgi:hypothetical protein